MKTLKGHFTVIWSNPPEAELQCPVCLDKFYVDPATWDGLYLAEDDVLKVECPSCGCREE